MSIQIRLNEWLDANRHKLNNSSRQAAIARAATSWDGEKVVYIWDMFKDVKDKGTWCSAEKQNGVWDGYVYKTHQQANLGGTTHLFELHDEGDLDGEPIEYHIDVRAIPISEVSDYTLEFSGI